MEDFEDDWTSTSWNGSACRCRDAPVQTLRIPGGMDGALVDNPQSVADRLTQQLADDGTHDPLKRRAIVLGIH